MGFLIHHTSLRKYERGAFSIKRSNSTYMVKRYFDSYRHDVSVASRGLRYSEGRCCWSDIWLSAGHRRRENPSHNRASNALYEGSAVCFNRFFLIWATERSCSPRKRCQEVRLDWWSHRWRFNFRASLIVKSLSTRLRVFCSWEVSREYLRDVGSRSSHENMSKMVSLRTMNYSRILQLTHVESEVKVLY